MSSDGSRTTTSSSGITQFGLRRSIDARTEEFLRLSRKRQIRQGCACAAVSTAITVTVVVVILLIYEYAIAVDSSLVQTLRINKLTNESDKPIADRLDRSYFGFDQDYFERMPLMVNAMQENSNAEPIVEITSPKSKARYIITNYSRPSTTTVKFKSNSIRRTSPRPFFFEFKHPTPMPFSKTYGSRSWVDSYRNAQRLKNLQQVIQYLEKTINAKFGDTHALPTSTIAFSGLYVEPIPQNGQKEQFPTPSDLQTQSSDKIETNKSNHQPDPLFSFKPDSPGDVNLLADGFFRFSPVPTPSLPKDKIISNSPMFRPIRHLKRHCIGMKCTETDESKFIGSEELSETKEVVKTSLDKTKSFRLMLNLFPLKPTNYDFKPLESIESTQPSINKIYITTSKPITLVPPVVQFRRRSTTPLRRIIIKKRPLIFPKRNVFKTVDIAQAKSDEDTEPKMIVHVNVYHPLPKSEDQTTSESNVYTTKANPPQYATEMPILTSTQVEDYHVGSSGIIPVESRLTPAPPPPLPISTPSLPTITTMLPFFDTTTLPFFDTTTSSTETIYRTTNPPEIIKFSHEDAKVPDQYKNLMRLSETTTSSTTTQSQPNKPTKMSRRNSEGNDPEVNFNVEPRTLIVKLKNDEESTTREANENYFKDDTDASTTFRTYVPQINGHYRSVNQNSKNINSWLNENTQTNRKRKIEMSVTGFRKSTYVPQYVEIIRNNTRNLSNEGE